MIELNKIYHEDCLIGMNKICDKSIDLILCDLPYGTTQNKWDSIIDLKELWAAYDRIIKESGAILLFAQTPFDKVLGASNLKQLKYEWIWEKENGTGFLNAKKMPLKNHENILVFYKKLPTYNPQMRLGFKPYKCKQGSGSESWHYDKSQGGHISESDGERYPLSIIKFNRDKNTMHPTQKPVALCEYLINTYTNEGDVVLDNCIGSGTTAIACINTNRNYIGFELEKKYYDIACQRIKESENNS